MDGRDVGRAPCVLHLPPAVRQRPQRASEPQSSHHLLVVTRFPLTHTPLAATTARAHSPTTVEVLNLKSAPPKRKRPSRLQFSLRRCSQPRVLCSACGTNASASDIVRVSHGDNVTAFLTRSRLPTKQKRDIHMWCVLHYDLLSLSHSHIALQRW